MAGKKKLSHHLIIEKYSQYVLENEKQPKNVFSFMKEIGYKEADFYPFFNSFETIEAAIFVEFYQNTIQLLDKNEDYQNFDPKNKLLSFYFTFFEILTANRSLIMYLLKNQHNKLKLIKKLIPLKKKYAEYVESLAIQPMDLNFNNAEKIMQKSVQEISWSQLLFTLNYWMNDSSPSFEKTDVLIEKSITTGFEFLNSKPLENIIDLGKFLVKDILKPTTV